MHNLVIFQMRISSSYCPIETPRDYSPTFASTYSQSESPLMNLNLEFQHAQTISIRVTCDRDTLAPSKGVVAITEVKVQNGSLPQVKKRYRLPSCENDPMMYHSAQCIGELSISNLISLMQLIVFRVGGRFSLPHLHCTNYASNR